MLKTNYISALLAATALSITAATPAAAQSVEDLQKQINMLQKQIEKLAKSQEKAQATEAKVDKASDPAFGFKLANGNAVNITGRMISDYAIASDKNDTSDVNAADIRSIQFGVKGKAFKKIGYAFVGEFADNKTSVQDAYIQYLGEGFKVTVGNSKEPIMQDPQGSPKNLAVMEQSAMSKAAGVTRQVGIAVGFGGDNWGWNTGIYRGTISNHDDAVTTLDGETHKVGTFTFASRASYGGKTSNGTWGVGGSFRERDGNFAGAYSHKAQAFNHMTGTYINGAKSKKDTLVGLDLAYQTGPFHAAAEWAEITAKDAASDGGNAKITGGYIEVGYMITGESRTYNFKGGKWNRPKINNPIHKGGMGGLQAVARYDVIDATGHGVYGGEQDTWVLGLTWFLNNKTRMMANYSNSSISNVGAPDMGKNSVNALGLRMMVDW